MKQFLLHLSPLFPPKSSRVKSVRREIVFQLCTKVCIMKYWCWRSADVDWQELQRQCWENHFITPSSKYVFKEFLISLKTLINSTILLALYLN